MNVGIEDATVYNGNKKAMFTNSSLKSISPFELALEPAQ